MNNRHPKLKEIATRLQQRHLAASPQGKSSYTETETRELSYTEHEVIKLSIRAEALDDETIIKKCVKLLEDRWQRIKNTNLAYPHSGDHPVVMACYDLAEFVAAVDKCKTKYEYLMPTLNPTALVSQQSLDHLDEYAPYQFVMSDQNDYAIIVEECLELGCNSKNSLEKDGRFKLRHTASLPSNKEYELSESERERTYRANQIALDYFVAANNARELFSGTLYEGLKLAVQDLKNGSVRGRGREEEAGVDSYEGVIKLKHLIGRLNQKDKNTLFSSRINGHSGQTFQSFWKTLSEVKPNDNRQGVTYCIDGIQRSLRSLIESNKVTLSKISLGNKISHQNRSESENSENTSANNSKESNPQDLYQPDGIPLSQKIHDHREALLSHRGQCYADSDEQLKQNLLLVNLNIELSSQPSSIEKCKLLLSYLLKNEYREKHHLLEEINQLLATHWQIALERNEDVHALLSGKAGDDTISFPSYLNHILDESPASLSFSTLEQLFKPLHLFVSTARNDIFASLAEGFLHTKPNDNSDTLRRLVGLLEAFSGEEQSEDAFKLVYNLLVCLFEKDIDTKFYDLLFKSIQDNREGNINIIEKLAQTAYTTHLRNESSAAITLIKLISMIATQFSKADKGDEFIGALQSCDPDEAHLEENLLYVLAQVIYFSAQENFGDPVITKLCGLFMQFVRMANTPESFLKCLSNLTKRQGDCHHAASILAVTLSHFGKEIKTDQEFLNFTACCDCFQMLIEMNNRLNNDAVTRELLYAFSDISTMMRKNSVYRSLIRYNFHIFSSDNPTQYLDKIAAQINKIITELLDCTNDPILFAQIFEMFTNGIYESECAAHEISTTSYNALHGNTPVDTAIDQINVLKHMINRAKSVGFGSKLLDAFLYRGLDSENSLTCLFSGLYNVIEYKSETTPLIREYSNTITMLIDLIDSPATFAQIIMHLDTEPNNTANSTNEALECIASLMNNQHNITHDIYKLYWQPILKLAEKAKTHGYESWMMEKLSEYKLGKEYEKLTRLNHASSQTFFGQSAATGANSYKRKQDAINSTPGVTTRSQTKKIRLQ